MPPLAAAAPPPAAPAAAAASGRMAPGAAFKVNAKSAVALVKERRIEFVRARNQRAIVKIDEASGKVVDPSRSKKGADVVVEKEVIERLLSWRHSRKIGPGLANLGNTCYLNSVLQCLSYTPCFSQYLLEKATIAAFGASGAAPAPKFMGKHHHQNNKGMVSQSFCGVRVMSRLQQSVHASGGAAPVRVLQPKELVMNIRHLSKSFRIGRQEDSHEFFRLLLDSMQRSCLRKAHIKQESHPAAATTFVHRVFGGKLKNTLKCAKCPYVSERQDDFFDLSLEIDHGISSVKGAIKHFTATETLDASNAWKCSSCNQLSRAEKGLTIDVCPNVLVLQLKRFDGMFGKIKKHIAFDTTLDLSVGMSKSSEDRQRSRNRYELHAVLVHAGFSTNCGHYYAFVKGPSGQWYEMNDECVRWVSVDTVLQQKAYMLFYSRVLPPSERPPPEPKPEKQAAAEPKAEPTSSSSNGATAVAVKPSVSESAKTEELSMGGFLASLRTDLSANGTQDADESDHGEREEIRLPVAKRTVVTYKVALPKRTLKRRLVPAFAGAIGKLARFRPVMWRATPLLGMTTSNSEDAGDESVPKTEKKAVSAPAPTSVAARESAAPARGVPINPRALRAFGETNSALYGRAVGHWDGEENGEAANGSALESELLAQHDRVLKNMKDEDWKHRRAQRKSSWDETLDMGKTKKLKKRKEFVANEGVTNAFQLALAHKKQRK
ncbi:hypothetical protein P43SY_006235 [Pythium insidiosum]|uniref:Ubiquitin carboxyl-terminal hydrolase n=1 Tax=Pythium insidiosum TaxID=114742 RepID=A0AAD5LJ76_PYTIN|nr:hypothetical protein P43SY_006235 [Pythium insidiosum]